MRDTLVFLGQGTAESTFFYTGFPPAFVEIRSMTTEEEVAYWTPMIPAEDAIEIDASTGIHITDADNGIRLVKFNDEPGSLPGSGGTPADVENGRWWEANGIEITDDSIPIINAYPYCVIVHRMSVPIVRAVHDGGASHVFFQDTSIDFLEAGISPNGKFILINVTNDNCAYIGAITKPAANMNHCRIALYEDENLVTATTAATIINTNVAHIIPRRFSQFPLIDLMT